MINGKDNIAAIYLQFYSKEWLLIIQTDFQFYA